MARAFPVPKIDNSINEKDFQPISILQVLSKIHEKVILKKPSDYIERTSIYNSTESGFRKGHSTQTILLKFRDDTTQGFQYSLTDTHKEIGKSFLAI